MKNTVLITLASLILVSCAHRKGELPAVAPVVQDQKPVVEPKVEIKSQALFHIVEPLGVKLVLLNLDKNIERTVLIEKTLSSVALTPGFWQVSGFVLQGQRFRSKTTTKQFIFHAKKNESTYAGSYIIQCPKVDQTHLLEMKKMSFFNRFPFSSERGACELVVGSDFENVNRVWAELEKSQQVPLTLGF